MSNKNTGGPAFPRPYSHDGFNDDTCLAQSGMTLRDYFAAKLLPTIYSEALRDGVATGFRTGWRKSVSEDVYAMADAMLKARES